MANDKFLLVRARGRAGCGTGAAPPYCPAMTWRPRACALILFVSLVAARPTGQAQQPIPPPSFDADVKPILDEVCTRCHNEKKANAGLNFTTFMDPATLASHRDTW